MSNRAVQVAIDADLAERLERLAAERRTTPKTLLEGLLVHSLDIEESEAEWDRQAQATFDEFERTGLHLTHEEVTEWLKRRSEGQDVPPPECHT